MVKKIHKRAKLKPIYITSVSNKDVGKMWRIAEELYRTIRTADKEEMFLLDKDSSSYIYRSMESSDICYEVRNQSNKLLCVLGVTSMTAKALDNAHCVWMLGSKWLTDYRREIIVIGRSIIKRLLSRYGSLCNMISKENKPALTWIKHMGAEFKAEHRVGHKDGIFIPFVIKGGDN